MRYKTLPTPKVANLLADQIREQILSGDLAHGEHLPSQEELLEAYGVGRSSLREALRILESERLIQVQRGNVGGATILRPTPEMAAFTLGMVLQSRATPLNDVGAALKLLEPLCAELCAGRDDREAAVVPTLTTVHQAAVKALDDPMEVDRQSRLFHEQLAALCGNGTLTVVVGALEDLWSTNELAWARVANTNAAFPELALRRAALDEHERILDCIRRGDSAEASREARKHLETSQLYPMSGERSTTVRVTV